MRILERFVTDEQPKTGIPLATPSVKRPSKHAIFIPLDIPYTIYFRYILFPSYF